MADVFGYTAAAEALGDVGARADNLMAKIMP
jgi:hypothetical protein